MNLIELVLITLPLPCLVRSFDYFEYFWNHSLLYKYYLPLSYIIPCTMQTWCLHCSHLLIQFTWAFSSFISYFVTLLADKILRKIGEGKISILLILSNNLWIKYLYFFHSIFLLLTVLGTFGQVLECWDRDSKALVAIKIVRSIKKYRDAAMVEVDVLQLLGRFDRTGSR